MWEAEAVGVVHRSAAPYRPAVAVNPDHVDVAGAAGDTLIEDPRPFVDHRQDHALDDLFLADRPPVHAVASGGIEDDFFDLGVRERRARSRFITEVSLPGFLAEMSGFAESIFYQSVLGAALADAPADIEPGQIHHCARPHRKPEPGHRSIDLLRQRPFEQQFFRFYRPARQHPVADKPVTYADSHRHLGEPAAERNRRT